MMLSLERATRVARAALMSIALATLMPGCGDATGSGGAAGLPGGGDPPGSMGETGTGGSGGAPGAGGDPGSGGAAGNPGTGGDTGSGGNAGGPGSGGSAGQPGTGGDTGTGGSGGDVRPWADNTGPHSPELLTPQNPGVITVDGTVIENAEMTGIVEIDADDVTIRNFRINGGLYGIRVASGHTGIVLEDGEIYNVSSAAVLGVGYTARRLHIHDSGKDGFKPDGSTPGSTVIEWCFIERLGTSPDAHADGIKSSSSNAPLTIRNNNIYMPYPGTPDYPGAPYQSNSNIKFDGAQVSGNLIDGNWLAGGNYTIFCVQDSGAPSITNNLFGRYNGGWSDDKEDGRLRTGNCGTWSGNRWEDDGSLIP